MENLLVKNKAFIIDRKKIVFLLLIFGFFLFLIPISKFYDQIFIKGILNEIKSSWYHDIILIIVFLTDLIILISLFRSNKRISDLFFTIVFILYILFFISRYFLVAQYEFYSFSFLSSIKYADIFSIFFISSLILKIKGWKMSKHEPIYFENPFIVDAPVKTIGDDKFSRKEFAVRIANKIQSRIKTVGFGSLAIGINGPWGSGKTSFLFMIKEALQKENRIIIDFNPWRSSSPSKIIENFFKTLVDELSNYDANLSGNLASYAKTLTEIDENLITRSLNTLSNFLFEDVSTTPSYNRINEFITKSKRTIINIYR